MGHYFLHGKLAAKAGSGEQLTSILLDASQALSAVKGCILYAISKDDKDRDMVWITEIWSTKQDHDDSLKLESVKTLISLAMPLLGAQPQKGQELEVLGGKGVGQGTRG